MRILKTLLISVVVLIIALILAVFIAREVLVLGSVQLVIDRYNALVKAVSDGQYKQQCLSLGVFVNSQLARLRFISKTEYVTEVVCGTLDKSAITVDTYKMWPLVQKSVGDSGLSELRFPVTVGLEVAGRKAAARQDELGAAYLVWRAQTVAGSGGPLTNCGGYGMTCCVDGEEQGIGDQVGGVSDCPRGCFTRCDNRPVVLAFNSSPFYDYETRVLTVKPGQAVDFSYVISESQRDKFADSSLKENSDLVAVLLSLTKQTLMKPDSQADKGSLSQVTIDFGDGETTTLVKLQDTASHTYLCQSAGCQYKAAVFAKNEYGAETLTSFLSTITINVVP